MTSSAQPSWLVWHENDIPALGSALHRMAVQGGQGRAELGIARLGKARHGRRSLAKPVGGTASHCLSSRGKAIIGSPAYLSAALFGRQATALRGRRGRPTPAFIADYNARFGKAPANNKDLHRPLRVGDNLDDAFAWKEEPALSQALTLQYDKVIFILEPSEQAKAAIGRRVTVIDYPDGRLAIRYRGLELAYRTFDKLRQVSQAAIVENKQLGAALAFIREEQLRREPERRSGPRRRDQHDARLFKVG
jgi:hypothetical protein